MANQFGGDNKMAIDVKEIDCVSKEIVETCEEPDSELSPSKKLKPPIKSICLIISTELCERFCYYGMKAILSLYLLSHLHYTEEETKIIYHTYVMMVYCFPIMGSFLADNWFGKYKIVVCLSFVYAIGNFLLSVASGFAMQNISRSLSIVGLVLISFGTGGIKPCVAAFGGDQFVLPQQERLMKKYFSVYYFITSTGSLTSTFLTPILAENVQCFGSPNTCYPLAFGIPGILMALSFCLFTSGRSGYNCKNPKSGENHVFRVIKCIHQGLRNRYNSERKPDDHFIDYASNEKFSIEFKNEVKSVLKVLSLYFAFPIFWTLYDQKASNWVFLAKKMNRNLPMTTYEVLPDHILLINPLLTLALIPLFELVIYPQFAKINWLVKPLHRMLLGNCFILGSFIVASIVQIRLENGLPLHILWLLPQFLLLTIAEVLFSVTGVQFSYSEAPDSMKSVIQAFWLLTSTGGNLLLIIITKLNFVRSGAQESIFYTGLMALNIIFFAYLAISYAKNKRSSFKTSDSIDTNVRLEDIRSDS